MSQVHRVKEAVDKMNITVDCVPSVTERCLSSCMCYECIIEDYSTLKEKVYYSMSQEMEFPERTLKLYKTKRIHTFQFHCELTNSLIQKMSGNYIPAKMELYIMYDQEEAICPGELVETNYGYSIEIPNEVISDPGNKYLNENDKLIIQFRYRYYFYSRGPICQSGTSMKQDEERLSKDLLSLYKSGVLTDFAIVDEDGKKHFVHKSFCRTRSATIDNIDDMNVFAIQVEGKSRHVEAVIQYIYSGVLPQLLLDDLLKVAMVAENLDIASLRHSVRFSLLEMLNKATAEKIQQTALKLNMHQLVVHAEEFLPQRIKNRRKNRR